METLKKIAKVKLLIVVIFSYSNICCQRIEGNSYELISFDNKKIQIRIRLDYVNEKMIIGYEKKDSVCIKAFKDLKEDIKVIDNKFILIHFKTSGGTGVRNEKIILISANNDKLLIAFDIFSLYKSEFKYTYNPSIDSLHLYDEKEIDSISISHIITEEGINKFKVSEFCKTISKYEKNKNLEVENIYELLFDSNNKIFYNIKDTLRGEYVIINTYNNEKKKVFNEEIFPAIKFKNNEYFFIESRWYEVGRDNYLIDHSYSCN